MSGQYASRTSVPVSKSIQEIEAALRRYGASAFHYGSDDEFEYAIVGFKLKGRQVKMRLPLPSQSIGKLKYEQAERQRYRALLLVVKAKLEAIAAGVTTLEREWLPDIVTATGQTVSEVLAPQIEEMYRTGRVPSLLVSVERPMALLEGEVVP